jgi:hypothetical protein
MPHTLVQHLKQVGSPLGEIAMKRLLIVLVALMITFAGSMQATDKAANKKSEAVRVTKGPVIEWVGAKDAVIAWSTNVRANTNLRYGTDKNSLAETARAPWGQQTHRVHLRNLKPATTYYFVADSGQAQGSGTEAKTGEGSFTTVAAGQKGKQYPNGRQ